jgi:hypothetical protein
MVLTFFWKAKQVNSNVTWDDLVLFKLDLKGAFNLLNILPDDCHLFAVELTDDMVMFYVCLMFGWMASPFAFNVISRALLHEFRKKLHAVAVDIFVDDTMGCCLRTDLPEVLAIAAKIIRDLLGPRAVAEDKTESGRRLDFIGWTVDLDKRVVSIARRNHLRALYGFYRLDTAIPVPIKTLQRVASLASRYSKVCRGMRPFTSYLYGCYSGIQNSSASVPMTFDGKRAVYLWRALLCLVRLQ